MAQQWVTRTTCDGGVPQGDVLRHNCVLHGILQHRHIGTGLVSRLQVCTWIPRRLQVTAAATRTLDSSERMTICYITRRGAECSHGESQRVVVIYSCLEQCMPARACAQFLTGLPPRHSRPIHNSLSRQKILSLHLQQQYWKYKGNCNASGRTCATLYGDTIDERFLPTPAAQRTR